MKLRAKQLENRPSSGFCRMGMMTVLLVAFAADPILAQVSAPANKDTSTESKPKPATDKEMPLPPEGAPLTNSGLKAFGQMIPLGSRSRGVRIPAFDKGKPSSLIIADAMTRLDDESLMGEKMEIHIYAEKKEEDMRIDMKTGTYNMDQQILSSTERSRVSRPDFQIEGDSMVFDTKTSQGKMVGNVEMIIFDAGTASQKMNIQSPDKSAADAKKTPADAQPGNPVNKK
jgi:hypothetical protein